MDLLTASATVAVGVFIHFLAQDLYKRAPEWAARLMRFGARALPSAERPRYEEEWLAALDEHTGALSKLWYALRCVAGAPNLGRLLREQPVVMTVGAETMRMSEACALVIVALCTAAKSDHLKPIASEADVKAMVSAIRNIAPFSELRKHLIDNGATLAQSDERRISSEFRRALRLIGRAVNTSGGAGVQFTFEGTTKTHDDQ